MDLEWRQEYSFLAFNTLDSTNLEAKRIVLKGIEQKLVIVSNEQTKGKGRNSRIWDSPSGNLYMSILLRSDDFCDKKSDLSFVTAITVYEALFSVIKDSGYDFDLTIKWPNDILVNHAKIAGILLESIKSYGKDYLIIGIGINISYFPKFADKQTTSLEKLNIKNITPSEILDKVMESFSYYYKLWQNEGFEEIRKLWLARSFPRGSIITISDGKNRISGIFEDIDGKDGAIMVKLLSGEIRRLSSGDVFFGNDND